MGALTRWLSLRGYGLVTSLLFGAATPPQVMRARLERLGEASREKLRTKFPRAAFGDHRAGAVAIESVRAMQAPQRAVLYLHGGAYFMGSPASYRRRTLRVSFRFDAEVFAPDYRLAPEHPYPTALDDAVAAWRFVMQACPGKPAFVAGDSAGGGLSLALLMKLRDMGLPLPRGAILLSPWTDLTASGPSVESNSGKDLWFTRRHLETWARYYAPSDQDRRSPYASPVFGDMSHLPDLMILAAEDELLLDDARRVRDAAESAGTRARLLLGKGMQHDWPLTLPWLAESREAWAAMQRFVEET